MRILMSLLVAIFFVGGHTSANGSECGELDGVEKGLCISYEKLDCVSIADNMHEAACKIILSKYITLTGTVPPCITTVCTSCPATAIDELINWFVANGNAITSYTYESNPMGMFLHAVADSPLTCVMIDWRSHVLLGYNRIAIQDRGAMTYYDQLIDEEEARHCASLVKILYHTLGYEAYLMDK